MKKSSLSIICLGFFMVVMDVTIVNVALPSIKAALNTSMMGLEWVVDGYTLTFAAFLLVSGFLGGQYNTKRVFQFGIILFSLSSLGCGLSNSISQLVLLRVLQGIGAAFVLPNSLNLINQLSTDELQRTKLIGIWAAIGGIAAAVGPIVGGLLTELMSWRSVFLVNVPLGLICIIYIEKTIPTIILSSKRLNIDVIGQILGILSIAALAFALISVSDCGWVSAQSVIHFALFILLLIAFIYSQLKVPSPMLPIHLFKSKHFSIAVLVGLIMNIAFYGELFILPLYFHQQMGLSIAKTGFAMIPLMLVTGISSYLSSKFIQAIGAKLVMMIGFFIGVIGFISLLMVIAFQFSYLLFILPLALIGFGMAFIMPAATVVIISSVSNHYHGVASGAINMARQVGSLIGVAIFGSVITSMITFTFGVEVTLMLACGLFMLGLIISLLVDQC